MLEKDIKKKILKYLRSIPDSDWEVSPPGSPTAKGDITGTAACLMGIYTAIEVKQPGKKLRKAQSYKLDRMEKAHVIVIREATSVAMVKEKIEAIAAMFKDTFIPLVKLQLTPREVLMVKRELRRPGSIAK